MMNAGNTDVFSSYSQRNVRFYARVRMEQWSVKLYTLTTEETFSAYRVLERVERLLPCFLKKARDHHHAAFIIVHEGADGVWVIVNWWTGGNMLRTTTYYSAFRDPESLTQIPKEGSMTCVWELPLIMHERDAWVKHMLMQAESPDLEGYFGEVFEGKI